MFAPCRKYGDYRSEKEGAVRKERTEDERGGERFCKMSNATD
jgi:hypothetical protein